VFILWETNFLARGKKPTRNDPLPTQNKCYSQQPKIVTNVNSVTETEIEKECVNKPLASGVELFFACCETMVGPRKWAAKLDMYRKVPVDLLEGSKQGSFISWMAIFTILLLFYKETRDYFTANIRPHLMLDRRPKLSSTDHVELIRADFNITMMDLHCDYVEVDVVSVLGVNQNVTKDIRKYPIDANGVMDRFARRNAKQHDIDVAMFDKLVVETLEDLHQDGVEAVNLDEQTLAYALNEYSLVFVDFFASWCSHCQVLAPTWEVFARVMNDVSEESEAETKEAENKADRKEAKALPTPVLVGKVDCVSQHALCMNNEIYAYPTLRLFVEGKRYKYGDYNGHRTVIDLIHFLKASEDTMKNDGSLPMDKLKAAVEWHLDVSPEEKHWTEALERSRHHLKKQTWDPKSHPGCQISGSLLLQRVPGNFYIQAFSPHHDLNPYMTNVSHEIHQLSFSTANDGKKKKHLGLLPKDFSVKSLSPFDGNVYVTRELHEAYHHYVKLVTTNDKFFQVLQSTQLATYTSTEVPEAKFIIDLSPIAVLYRDESRGWYDYLTSVMAIIGGTFTVVGFFEMGVRQVSRRVSQVHRPVR